MELDLWDEMRAMELPGVDPAEDVTVTIEEGDLVVRGERKRKEEVKDEDQERQDDQGRLGIRGTLS